MLIRKENIMKIFTTNYDFWKVFYKKKEENSWTVLIGQKGFWYADPMIIKFQKKNIYLLKLINYLVQ